MTGNKFRISSMLRRINGRQNDDAILLILLEVELRPIREDPGVSPP